MIDHAAPCPAPAMAAPERPRQIDPARPRLAMPVAFPPCDPSVPPALRDQLTSIVMATAAAIRWCARDGVYHDEIADALRQIACAADRSCEILAAARR